MPKAIRAGTKRSSSSTRDEDSQVSPMSSPKKTRQAATQSQSAVASSSTHPTPEGLNLLTIYVSDSDDESTHPGEQSAAAPKPKPKPTAETPLTEGIWRAWTLLARLGTLEGFGDPFQLTVDELVKVVIAITSAYHTYRGLLQKQRRPKEALTCDQFYGEVQLVWHYQNKKTTATKSLADTLPPMPFQLGVHDLFNPELVDGIGELCEGMLVTMMMLADLDDSVIAQLAAPPHRIHHRQDSMAARGARLVGHNHYVDRWNKTKKDLPAPKGLVPLTYQVFRDINNQMLMLGTKKVDSNGITLPPRRW
ncbi:uncharacterized protein LOC62_02G003368 [Vanrija pseudolonga]|uniref:Uncharacterized protein n=1 Tax=Vanrija pseudolonga TaxID=143232 RepID=A0AAF0YA71_9TREE|nr:hypothetical protein LOC62_02G003368 [Vanrija pseudolonga]